MQVPAGSTNVQVPIYARATSGAALTGKVAADFALSYRRDGAAVSIALSNLTALTDAHSDGGIKEVGNGEYRLDVPDAAFAAGASKVTIGGTVDGGVVLGYPIELAISAWDELKSEHTTAGTFGLWLGTKLWNWIGAVAGKTADTATRAEINATTAGAGYNETTDSLEANRDNIGTAGAGLTAVGAGSSLTAQEVRDAMKLAPTAGDPAAGSVDKHLDDILEDTSTTLLAQIAALDIGGGTGTYACTWTVNDGSTALEGATVSFWLAGVLRGTGTTNSSGQVPMSLDAGTYTVAISLSGYTFASTTHTVSSTASTWTKTFSMTAITFTAPPDAEQVTAWGYVYGPAGTIEPGATVVLEQRTAGARQIYDNAPRTLTADGSGVVSAVVWADGSEYRYRRGTGGEWSELFAPEDDEDPDLPNSYRLPGWLGAS